MERPVPAGRRGVALIEVLAAMVILTVAGLSLVELAGAGARDLAATTRRERELADQERLLASHTLLDRAGLVRRLGSRRVGDCVVTIQRPERGLYRVAVARHDAPDVEDLVTVVFRPDSTDAP